MRAHQPNFVAVGSGAGKVVPRTCERFLGVNYYIIFSIHFITSDIIFNLKILSLWVCLSYGQISLEKFVHLDKCG